MKKVKKELSIELIPSYLEKSEYEQKKEQIKDIIARMIILGMEEEETDELEIENKNLSELGSTPVR